MNIIVALLIFTVIVVAHELGHFLLAKKNGIGVPEFSVGMGPRTDHDREDIKWLESEAFMFTKDL